MRTRLFFTLTMSLVAWLGLQIQLASAQDEYIVVDNAHARQGALYFSEPQCGGRAYVLRDAGRVARTDLSGKIYLGSDEGRSVVLRSVRSEFGCQGLGEAHGVAFPVMYVIALQPPLEIAATRSCPFEKPATPATP